MIRPFSSELVCTGQRAITTTDDQSIDAMLDEIVNRFATTLNLSKGLGTLSTN